MPDLDTHYKPIIKFMIQGRVIPFFGAGVNLCGRPQGEPWCRDEYLPSGGELAQHLAKELYLPEVEAQDLLGVSQFVALKLGTADLYYELHQVFDCDYPPTAVHQFFAAFPATLREKGYPARYPLIITTNYDDLMERAFQQADEPFDMVSYVADGEERGKFLHWPPQAEPRLIEKPNEYHDLSLKERPVILKIHGAVDRLSSEAERDSYVITEDHYIDYLTRTDIVSLVPATLVAKIKHSHLLFLGYSLRDWNLRVILHRIWRDQKLTKKSWAIRLHPDPIEEEFWNKRDVDIINLPLEDYIAGLSECFQAWPALEVNGE